MFQYAKSELVGQNVLILHPSNAVQELPGLWNRLKTEGSLTDERTFVRKDGSLIEVEISRNMLPDQSGAIAILRDISVRKKYETQQKLMASIVNNSDDAIISKTLDGIITSWNKGAEMILGYTAEEAIGRHITLIFPEELYEEETTIIEQIKKGHAVDHFETRRQRKDGTILYVSVTVSPLFDPAGNITGASKILRDISEKVRAEETIRQSEANYRQLFDESPVAMWVADPETQRFIQVNKACIAQYGYSQEAFLELRLADIIPGVGQLIETSGLSENAKTPNSFKFEQEHIRQDGTKLEVVTSAIPVVLTGRRQWLMIAMDVTEKNRFEQQLTRAAIKVQEQERYEIGGELHDNVCQILATCLIYLDMMRKHLHEEGLKLYEKTRSFINLASTETRNLSHQLAPVFIDESDIEEVFKRLLNNFNLQNHYEISLLVDPIYKVLPLNNELQLNLYRILQEQLRNIYKHADATAITIAIGGNEALLEMTIADNGRGFDPGSVKGGIGIANMKRRVKLFNGIFLVHSSPGNGCELYIQVPLTKI
ncbi:MAG TPA: PAS domain S-box protein, partial [Sediminibacterium sp.]|nr:PAS domain S-box protein [Sediminibacterium sp.]